MKHQLILVGGGNMSTALLSGLIRSGSSPEGFLVIDPNAEQRSRLEASLGVTTAEAPPSAINPAASVLWAVKPQLLQRVAKGYAGIFRAMLNISVVSAVRSDMLVKWLQTDRIIRTMPNTPALVSAGVTGMLAGTGATDEDKKLAESVMSAIGKVFWVSSDDEINAITAVTGSGPGYIFYFLEAMQQAAIELGFSADQARELVLLNALGSVQQARAQLEPFATLADRVASKGGTTAAAFSVMNAAQMPSVVSKAMHSAKFRAEELADELSIGL